MKKGEKYLDTYRGGRRRLIRPTFPIRLDRFEEIFRMTPDISMKELIAFLIRNRKTETPGMEIDPAIIFMPPGMEFYITLILCFFLFF